MSKIRLIDANVMRDNIKGSENNQEFARILREWVDAQKTVEAITVDWLKERQSKEKRGSAIWWMIEELIEEWYRKDGEWHE
jgi:hypothetical protein